MITLERAQELAEEVAEEVRIRYNLLSVEVIATEKIGGLMVLQPEIVVRITVNGGGEWGFAICRKILENFIGGEELMLSRCFYSSLCELVEDNLP